MFIGVLENIYFVPCILTLNCFDLYTSPHLINRHKNWTLHLKHQKTFKSGKTLKGEILPYICIKIRCTDQSIAECSTLRLFYKLISVWFFLLAPYPCKCINVYTHWSRTDMGISGKISHPFFRSAIYPTFTWAMESVMKIVVYFRCTPLNFNVGPLTPNLDLCV